MNKQKPRISIARAYRTRIARLTLGASVAFVGAFSVGALARDRIGELQVSDFLLEPTFLYSEPKTGRFQAGNSLVSVSWIRDSFISGKIALGTKALLGQPARYGVQEGQEVGIVEGYAQGEGYLGRVRLGLVPIPFGLEGGDVEGRLRFPRSYLYRKSFVPLRDYGVAYSIEHEGFFSEWEAHNGEAGADLDNQIWLTARWGWSPNASFRIGASAQTGRTTPASTNPSGVLLNKDSAIDPQRGSKTRLGNFFVEGNENPVSYAAEATLSSTDQDGKNLTFSDAHVDVYWTTSPEFGVLARYDQFNSKSDLLGDNWAQEYTVGAAYRHPYETSMIFVYLSKQIQKNVTPDEHLIRLVWRLTPYVGSRL